VAAHPSFLRLAPEALAGALASDALCISGELAAFQAAARWLAAEPARRALAPCILRARPSRSRRPRPACLVSVSGPSLCDPRPSLDPALAGGRAGAARAGTLHPAGAPAAPAQAPPAQALPRTQPVHERSAETLPLQHVHQLRSPMRARGSISAGRRRRLNECATRTALVRLVGVRWAPVCWAGDGLRGAQGVRFPMMAAQQLCEVGEHPLASCSPCIQARGGVACRCIPLHRRLHDVCSVAIVCSAVTQFQQCVRAICEIGSQRDGALLAACSLPPMPT